jgi:NADH:ubiquinone oxidoreductase subunit 4 (subunit M)
MIILISLVLLLWLIYFWRGNYQPNEALFDLKFSLTIITTLLTSYHLNVHDLSLLTVPAILTLNRILTASAQAHIGRSIFLWFLLPLWFPLTYIFLLANRQLSWISWLILVLAAGLALEIFRSNRLQSQISFARF